MDVPLLVWEDIIDRLGAHPRAILALCVCLGARFDRQFRAEHARRFDTVLASIQQLIFKKHAIWRDSTPIVEFTEIASIHIASGREYPNSTQSSDAYRWRRSFVTCAYDESWRRIEAVIRDNMRQLGAPLRYVVNDRIEYHICLFCRMQPHSPHREPQRATRRRRSVIG